MKATSSLSLPRRRQRKRRRRRRRQRQRRDCDETSRRRTFVINTPCARKDYAHSYTQLLSEKERQTGRRRTMKDALCSQFVLFALFSNRTSTSVCCNCCVGRVGPGSLIVGVVPCLAQVLVCENLYRCDALYLCVCACI